MNFKKLKLKNLKKLLTLDFYLDALAATLRFFIKHNPIIFWFWTKAVWENITSVVSGPTAKDVAVGPLRSQLRGFNQKARFDARSFNQAHPYVSASSSMVLILLMLFGTVYFSFLRKTEPAAAWWNDTWGYRKSIAVTNSSGSALTDFQVKILDNKDLSADITAGKIQSDLDDLRFTDINGNVLPYWIEDATGASVDVWIKMSSIPTTGATVYMYYGNSSATSKQDGEQVFEFFDDFSGSDIDSGKWDQGTTASTSGTNFSISDGKLNGGNTNRYIQTKVSYTGNYVAETRVYTTTSPTNGYVTVGFYASSSDSFGILDHNGSSYYRNDSGWTGFSYNGTGQWNRDKVKVVSTSATYWRTGETSGSATATVTNSGISNEYLRLSPRYDTSQLDQNYVAQWDWIFVRKAVSSDPSAGTPATEEKSKGPVGYWSFDEGQGTTAQDGSQNNNDGTITGAVWKPESECVSGKCLWFDGTDDTINIENNQIFAQENMTISTWINAKDFTQWRGLFYIRETNTTNYLIIRNDGDGLTILIEDDDVGVVNLATPVLETNTWLHLAFTQDGSGWKFYKNGKLSTLSGTNSAYCTDHLTINNVDISFGGWDQRYINGSIDEFKVYNYARTADEIKQDYNAGLAGMGASTGSASAIGGQSPKWMTDGLVGHWKMDEASCGPTDYSGNGNNGTCNNSPTVSVGKYGNGVTFNGTSDQTISKTDNSSLSVSNVSLSLWVYLNNTTGTYQVFGWKGTDYEISMNNSRNPRFGITTSGGRTVSDAAGTTLSLSQWYNIVLTYDGSVIKGYVNGSLIHTQNHANPGNITDSGNSFEIGNTSYDINGIMDEVRIYNRALSPDEVKGLYEYAPGPVGHWKMDDGSGLTANDSSGNGNNMTLTNATWTNGKYGRALNFDGSGDYARVTNTNVGAMGQRNFTVSFWLKHSNLPDSWYDTLATPGNGSGDPKWEENWAVVKLGTLQAAENQNKIGFEIGKGTGNGYFELLSSTKITDDNWHYISAVAERNGSAKIYIDGKLDNQMTISSYVANLTSPSGIYFGANTSNSFNLLGQLDDFKIYNYACTAKQIVEDMNAGHPVGGSPVGSQLAYWKFDEGQGGTAYNSGNGGTSLNGNLGVGSSAPTWTNDGKFGKALSFDASDDYVDMPTLPNTTSITISGWFKYNQAPASRYLSIVTNWWNTFGKIYINTSGQLVWRWEESDNSTWNQLNSGTISTDDWHYFAATFNKNLKKGKLYLDGEEVYSEDANDIERSTNTMVIVGHDQATLSGNSEGLSFDGQIDEIKIYNSALSEDEIQKDYNHGKSLELGSVGTDASGNASKSSDRAYCPPGDTTASCGPIAEWKLDEGTGTTANDTSGNGYVGTLDQPTFKNSGDCIYNNCVEFDGVNDYINTTYGSATHDDFTIEGWFYDTKGSGYRAMVQYSSTGDEAFYVYPTTSQVGLYPCGSASGLVMPTNEWTHLAATYDLSGNSIKYYKNGQYITSTTACSAASTWEYLRIGANGTGDGERWKGKMDDIRVFNYVRTPEQIAWDYNRGKPVGHWKMDEGEGTTVYDHSGNGNNGTMTNMDAGTDWVDGKYNSALDFDGGDDYVLVTEPAANNFDSDYISVSVWYKSGSNDPTQWQKLIGKGPDVSEAFALWVSPSDVVGPNMQISGTNRSVYGTKDIADQNWHHIVGVFDGNYLRVYIDGELNNSANYAGVITSNNENISIGKEKSSSTDVYPVYGQLDDVRIFNYALTAEQVKEVMNDGAIRYGD